MLILTASNLEEMRCATQHPFTKEDFPVIEVIQEEIPAV